MNPSPTLSPSLAAPVPVRSPRTSILLAELARQRRLERSKRRLKRRQRRQAWARWMGWLAALGRWPAELSGTRTPAALGIVFPGAVPLVYVLET